MYNGVTMPRAVEWNEFQVEHLATLQEGDVAFHGMLYPGVYPPDRERFEQSKTEGVPTDAGDNPYFRFIKRLAGTGVRVARLRVLPTPGANSHTQLDVDTMQAWAGVAKGAGEDVRTVSFDAVVPGLREVCGPSSGIANAYLDGAKSPYPKASFWSIRRRQTAGQLALTAVNVMDYHEGGFASTLYEPRFPSDLGRFVQFWHGVFKRARWLE